MYSFLLLAGVVEALVSPRTATLGLGCFWEPSETLLKLDGVVDTRCGYAGATFPDAKPDYNSVCGGDGNVECVRVTYDASVVDYEAVLDAAFAAAKPVLGSRQYAPIVFAADEAAADAVVVRLRVGKRGARVAAPRVDDAVELQ